MTNRSGVGPCDVFGYFQDLERIDEDTGFWRG